MTGTVISPALRGDTYKPEKNVTVRPFAVYYKKKPPLRPRQLLSSCRGTDHAL